MALPLVHSYSRNESRDATLSGKYGNIRIHGLVGNMNPFQPWATLKQALAAPPSAVAAVDDAGQLETVKAGSNAFMQFSASCYYFGQSLSDELSQAGNTPPPIGLIHTAWGGSTVEQWLSNAAIETCAYAKISPANQEYHDSRVLPYVGMSLKGWVWYQGRYLPPTDRRTRLTARSARAVLGQY